MNTSDNPSTNLNEALAVVSIFDRATEVLGSSPLRRGCAIRLPAQGRLLATGDLHDNPDHLRKIIALAHLDASSDHHIVLHEMIHGGRLINGMDFSHRMLARVAELVNVYPGQVHPLLANHELAQMTGKGVSKGAGNSVELFTAALEFVFDDEWESVAASINRFIRTMPLALLSEGGASGGGGHSGVCCAHSLPNASLSGFDARILDRELTDEDYAGPSGAAYAMVWGRRHTIEQVEEFARRWNVRLFCLGHQHAETGIEMKGPRVIVLNSDHERACALPLELNSIPTAEEAMMMAVPLAAV